MGAGTSYPLRRLAAPVALVLIASAAGAEDLKRFTDSLRRNRQELQDYSWKSRTEIRLDGETQTVQLFEVRYDPDGNLRRTLISQQGAPKKVRGPLRTQKVKKKQQQQQELQASLQALIEAYVQPDADSSQRLFAGPNVWQGQGRTEGVTRIQARNVLRKGDEVSLWLDSLTHTPQKLQILTSSEGEPVRVTTEFRVLDGGPFYPARISVETEIKEKKLVLTTENFDYLAEPTRPRN
jgi:hypothetical protein